MTTWTVPPDSVRAAIDRRVAGGAHPAELTDRQWERVRRLYDFSGRRALWLEEDRLHRRAGALVSTLADAPSHGLRVDAYPIGGAREALAGVRASGRPTPAQLAELDVVLTSAYVAFAEDLLTGQVDPRSVARGWHIDPQEVGVDSALARTLGAASFEQAIAQLQPRDDGYDALRGELARFRQLVASGGWTRVPDGGLLRPGDTSTVARLVALAERLRAEGLAVGEVRVAAVPDTVPDEGRGGAERRRSARAVYDAPLAGGVARYQERHGLVIDSIVGPNTLAALNTPAEYRMRQLVANLERYRWLPRALGDRYILVNVPAFRLQAFDDGKRVLSMGVIVGAQYDDRTTPAFSDSMSYVVFRPYWNVPRSIAASELWPEQRRDPAYFARHGYEVVRASWGTYVRQRPGPENALGRVKFIFPNDFAIYLHDTPAHELFRERVRAFSHGCIRVERPDELALFALGPQGWDPERIRQAMHFGPDDHRVDLERKLPVYIVYFTTYVRNGQLHFAKDLYDRDDALVRAVRGAAMPDAETLRQLDALQRLARELVAAD